MEDGAPVAAAEDLSISFRPLERVDFPLLARWLAGSLAR